jgi:hypothetical protein
MKYLLVIVLFGPSWSNRFEVVVADKATCEREAEFHALRFARHASIGALPFCFPKLDL